MSSKAYTKEWRRFRLQKFWRIILCETVTFLGAGLLLFPVTGIGPALFFFSGLLAVFGVIAGALWHLMRTPFDGKNNTISEFLFAFLAVFFAPAVLMLFGLFQGISGIVADSNSSSSDLLSGSISKVVIDRLDEIDTTFPKTIDDLHELAALLESLEELEAHFANHPKVELEFGLHIHFDDGRTPYLEVVINDSDRALVWAYKEKNGWFPKNLAGRKLKEWILNVAMK